MTLDKPYYVTSYVKQFAIDQSGTRHIDKSVYDEVQRAIECVLSRGFEIRKGKAVLKPASDAAARPSEAVSSAQPGPSAKKTKSLEELSGIPLAAVRGGGRPPTVLIRVADGTVMKTHADMDVTVIDIDRLGRMYGNPAYDGQISRAVSALRACDGLIRDFDCKGFADLLETLHNKRKGG